MKWCCGIQLEVLVGDAVQVSTTSIHPIPINSFAHGAEADTGRSNTLGIASRRLEQNTLLLGGFKPGTSFCLFVKEA